MVQQRYELKSWSIREEFLLQKKAHPERFARRIDLSWSVWMFGTEGLGDSLERLTRHGIAYVELKGDHHTGDSGVGVDEINKLLGTYRVRVSGTCGMFGSDNDLSSPSVYVRQRAIDYIRRELEVLRWTGGRYLIVVPSAVGRPQEADAFELSRSLDTLGRCVGDFVDTGIAAAIEPIRSSEVSLVNSVEDALRYIEAIDCPQAMYVNADTYHMSLEEGHVGEAILKLGDRLINLHLADTNRDGLGRGMLDLDTVIMASYLVGMNQEGRFLTPEPLGPYPDPYVLSNMPCDRPVMDSLVADTVSYFRSREDYVRGLA